MNNMHPFVNMKTDEAEYPKWRKQVASKDVVPWDYLDREWRLLRKLCFSARVPLDPCDNRPGTPKAAAKQRVPIIIPTLPEGEAEMERREELELPKAGQWLASVRFDTPVGTIPSLCSEDSPNPIEDSEVYAALPLPYLENPLGGGFGAYGKSYPCRTEKWADRSRLSVDLKDKMVPRLKPGSIMRWYVCGKGLMDYQAEELEKGMEKATDSWNSPTPGVHFVKADTAEGANLIVAYDAQMKEAYAIACFPDDATHEIRVGPLSFEPNTVEHLSNILSHELGHVQGLRHEFWYFCGEAPALSISGRPSDWDSIMNPYLVRDGLHRFRISETDKQQVERFYSLPGGSNGYYFIQDYPA